MEINLNINISGFGSDQRADLIISLLHKLLLGESKMSKELDSLRSNVEATRQVEDSAVVLLVQLSAQIAAIKDDPSAIQALSDELKEKSDLLAAAITANTPAPVQTVPVTENPSPAEEKPVE